MRRMLAVGAIGLGAASLGAVAAFELRLRPLWQSWGIDPEEARRPMPGDDLVPDAPVVETRGITIDAPPEAIWPWLVQMGYGRAGWYSYDALDMRGSSSDEIVPEWQSLAVGDTIQTDPDGGFHVKVVEPGRALVLYVDSSEIESRTARRQARQEQHDEVDVPAGLAMSSGLLSGVSPSRFAVSWAFLVEPVGHDRSRLIERYRVSLGPQGFAAVKGQALDLGVFIMTRRQMLGIRERAEALFIARGVPGTRVATETVIEPAPAGEPLASTKKAPKPAAAEPVMS